ncbi:LPP20 family lipoprotein [Helicobacter sp. MIT 14-3879]|uniref:LPP20 family lipoprotein n=1 Tax=Helicobacter sp. MIT 14-3879 TaxID=2040649 RepID=UPI000E1EA5F2|nr:LPP20 family lipoprotein [Helicobacter sp. MIT 14-3879]RDU65464.1 hypothetical protein CQA44_00275 [Helicobacter sp. MIT 14-3879]
MKIFLSFLVVLLIIGCSSKNGLNEGASSIENSALEANNLIGAPSWVLNGGSNGLSAIGSANISKAGLQFARNEALAMARDELARMVSVKVEGVINNAISQSIGNNSYNENVEKYSEQITKQIVSQTMIGTKQKDTWITPDGKQIFVLVEMDSSISNKAKESIMQSISNETMPVQKDKFLNALDKALGNGLE